MIQEKSKCSSIFRVAIDFFHLYSFLAKQDIRNRFRRSIFGVWWLVIQNLSFVLIANLVWARLFSVNSAEFIPFLALGLAVWGIVVAVNVESCMIFVNNRHYITQFALPKAIFVLRFMYAQFYYYSIALITSLVILILFGSLRVAGLLYVIPGLFILMLYATYSSIVFAYIGCRYRDLQYALSNFFSILFIVTPIIFPAEILVKKGVTAVLYLNPFVSFIEIIRVPLLNGSFAPVQYYIISIMVLSCLFIMQKWIEKRWDKRVIFWL